MDWYTQVLAAHPGCDISVIAHSNGTYILASALQRYATIAIKYAAFVGSVVPRAYPWDRFIKHEHKVRAIRNDVAGDDWVVAIFARFFEAVHELVGIRFGSFDDIGSGGFHGFIDDSVHECEHKFFSGGHSGPLRDERNIESLGRFVLFGKCEVDHKKLKTHPRNFWVWCSKFSVPIVLVIVGSVIWFGIEMADIAKENWNIPRSVAGIAYVILIVMLLILF
jgi:pimeloyl-ACP methyl ester carboxylesterase